MTATIDASVVVKWFKENEEFSQESLELLRRIRDFEIKGVMNEWVILEVIRALTKCKYERSKIHEIQHIIESMFDIGALRKITVSEVLPQAAGIASELGFLLTGTGLIIATANYYRQL